MIVGNINRRIFVFRYNFRRKRSVENFQWPHFVENFRLIFSVGNFTRILSDWNLLAKFPWLIIDGLFVANSPRIISHGMSVENLPWIISDGHGGRKFFMDHFRRIFLSQISVGKCFFCKIYYLQFFIINNLDIISCNYIIYHEYLN